jgi:hypothetical protein
MFNGNACRAIAAATFYIIGLHGLSADQRDDDQRELEIYRKYIPQIIKQQAQPQYDPSYQKYLTAWFDQETRLRETTVRNFEWQLFAGNVLLALLVMLTVGGIIFSGYQLFTAAKLGQSMGNTGFEASLQRVQVTTSTVGVIVLVISGIFLMLFLKYVYEIRYVDLPQSATATNTSTSKDSKKETGDASSGP